MVEIKNDESFQFFLQNVKELEAKYKGKFVAIKGTEILGAYPTFADAVKETVNQGHKAGSFIVQEANSDPKSYTVTYLNKGFFRVV